MIVWKGCEACLLNSKGLYSSVLFTLFRGHFDQTWTTFLPNLCEFYDYLSLGERVSTERRETSRLFEGNGSLYYIVTRKSDDFLIDKGLN